METLTLPLPDVLGASLACAVTPSLAEQLDALRRQHLALLGEYAVLRTSKAALEARVAELEGEVREGTVKVTIDRVLCAILGA